MNAAIDIAPRLVERTATERVAAAHAAIASGDMATAAQHLHAALMVVERVVREQAVVERTSHANAWVATATSKRHLFGFVDGAPTIARCGLVARFGSRWKVRPMAPKCRRCA